MIGRKLPHRNTGVGFREGLRTPAYMLSIAGSIAKSRYHFQKQYPRLQFAFLGAKRSNTVLPDLMALTTNRMACQVVQQFNVNRCYTNGGIVFDEAIFFCCCCIHLYLIKTLF